MITSLKMECRNVLLSHVAVFYPVLIYECSNSSKGGCGHYHFLFLPGVIKCVVSGGLDCV